jgi:hypothetical protein
MHAMGLGVARALVQRSPFVALTAALLLAPLGCGRPFLARDGTLVLPEPGAHGASVVTANGLEFHDVADKPHPIVVRDPYEPWRAPVGFIVPASGRFTKTSSPTTAATAGLSITLRPSDTRVPSWGGEILVRVDVLAEATKGRARWGEDVAIVLDGRGADTRALFEAAVAQLGGRDRLVVIDAAGADVVVPAMPASNRSLAVAAAFRRLASPPRGVGARDPAGAVRRAMAALSQGTTRRILVLSDEGETARDAFEPGLGDELLPLAVVATSRERSGKDPRPEEGVDARLGERLDAVRTFVPPAGLPAFDDVVLAFDATPAPSHVLEASGGDARWEPEGGELALGDVRAGDERSEVVRVTIPAWTAGESFTLHVAARFRDVTRDGELRTMNVDLPCVYDDDIERLADSRHGDVIAYASALATLARLDAAFLGFDASHPAVVRTLLPVARLHARSLALLARDRHDPAAAAQAALLDALLDATSAESP